MGQLQYFLLITTMVEILLTITMVIILKASTVIGLVTDWNFRGRNRKVKNC